MEKIDFDILTEEKKMSINVWDVPGFAMVCEYPFVRDDMTWGEYLKEKEYYGEHWEDVLTGTYKPLWKQNML